MRFIQGLKSLDDLLYEVMTWLVFYPVTLWRSLRHPLRTMEYARTELTKTDDVRFRDTLRPPVFLLVCVIIAYVIELAAVGEDAVVSSQTGAANLIADDQSMMILRIFAFALFPVIMASVETSLRGKHIDRDTLQAPFYAQCYLAAPFVLVLSLAVTAIRSPTQWIEPAALMAIVPASLVYVAIEADWLVRSTGRGWTRALLSAVGAFVSCILLLGALMWLFGGE